MSGKRVVVTGMAVNTPLGDTLDAFFTSLIAGKSAITRWRCFADQPVYSRIGADLTDYDVGARVADLEGKLPPDAHHRLKRLIRRVPWSTRLSLLVAADAWLDANLGEGFDPHKLGVIVGGHNIGSHYSYDMGKRFRDEPDHIDGLYCLYKLDSDHAGCVSELLQAKGPIYTTGAACASTNLALRSAVDEIRHHGQDAVILVGPVMHFSPVDVHAMALMGAITTETFNDSPEKASRPFDAGREGFVPAHGAGAFVLEEREAALRRGARIHAEVLAIAAGADGNHLPQPCKEGQAHVMRQAIRESGLRPEQIDFVSAHATSTPAGDISEIDAIKNVFGAHARHLKINAPKSMLGHTCWSSAVVELIAAIMQMQAGVLHPTINIDDLDSAIDLDVCGQSKVAHPVEHLLKNSFGFGGINCVSVLRRHDAGSH